MRSKKGDDKSPATKATGDKDQRSGRNVGDSLRAIYQDAVSESVPDEMLDLLRKLG